MIDPCMWPFELLYMDIYGYIWIYRTVCLWTELRTSKSVIVNVRILLFSVTMAAISQFSIKQRKIRFVSAKKSLKNSWSKYEWPNLNRPKYLKLTRARRTLAQISGKTEYGGPRRSRFLISVQDWVDIVPSVVHRAAWLPRPAALQCDLGLHCRVEILPKSMPWPGPSGTNQCISVWCLHDWFPCTQDLSWITRCLESSCQHMC